MQRLTVRLLIALITFAIGVAAVSVWFFNRSRSEARKQSPVTSQRPQVESPPAQPANPNGLEIPGLSQSAVAKPRRKFKPLASNDVHVTELITMGYVVATFSLYGRQENGEFASGAPRQLGVHQITRYDVEGQPFCYQILGNIPGVGALIAYDYYDDDGDGKFDRSVSGKWPKPPIPPEWVLRKK